MHDQKDGTAKTTSDVALGGPSSIWIERYDPTDIAVRIRARGRDSRTKIELFCVPVALRRGMHRR